MKILVFSWRDPKHPLAGGAEQVMHEHMKGWVKAGNAVTLFSSKMPGLVGRENLDGVEVVRSGYQYVGVQLSGFLFYLKNKNRFDFIVDQFHGLPFFTPLYCRKPKLAIIQEPARDVWLKNPLPFPFNWIIGLLGYLAEPVVFLLYRNTKFLTGSVSAKESLTKYGIKGRDITIVPHGVITPKEKVKSEKEKVKTIAYLGILSKDKGIEDAIKTFYLLDKKDNYNFWVIGRPETKNYFSFLRRMVRRSGLEAKVRFFGHVSDEKKFGLLARAHILINPSIHEGWGLVNIEANSVGTPVVCYPSHGLTDSVKNNISGIVVESKKPAALAQGIERLLNDGELYEKLVGGAVDWSNKFNWINSKNLSLKLLYNLTK